MRPYLIPTVEVCSDNKQQMAMNALIDSPIYHPVREYLAEVVDRN
jgi:hypothetical protein